MFQTTNQISIAQLVEPIRMFLFLWVPNIRNLGWLSLAQLGNDQTQQNINIQNKGR